MPPIVDEARRGWPWGPFSWPLTSSIRTVGETVRAFVPDPLPPAPPLELSGARQQRLESALLACGRLDGIAAMLPDPEWFLYSLGIVREVTGRKRERVFSYTRYLDILNEGAEPL